LYASYSKSRQKFGDPASSLPDDRSIRNKTKSEITNAEICTDNLISKLKNKTSAYGHAMLHKSNFRSQLRVPL